MDMQNIQMDKSMKANGEKIRNKEREYLSTL